jgi:GT2 family glycosyltransferase
MTIDVIIPVYRGLEQTRRCIESVLRCTPPSIGEIVVVDDATPEPAIAQWLDQVASQGRITLLRNESNVGFVRSVNRGMDLHRDRDVVLLNSDAEVANDWLSRLRDAAHREPDIATVTPLSNNATICSYPFWGWTGATPGTLGLEGLDALAARANAGHAVDIPTAVGFCMYIRRDALAALGLFDAERFGRGYGEENDFSLRALKSGRRNVLAGDVFVYHEGGVSFSEETSERTVAATRALLEVHPDYHARVHAFLAAVGSAPLLMAIDIARIGLNPEEKRSFLEERQAEQHLWAARARGMEQEVERREAGHAAIEAGFAELREQVARLSVALAAHERASEEAKGVISQLGEEIASLRRGLAHAEELAFAREKQLSEIRGLPLWRYYHYLMKRASRSDA